MIPALLIAWALNDAGVGTVTVTAHESYEACIAHVDTRPAISRGMWNCVTTQFPELVEDSARDLIVNGCKLTDPNPDRQVWTCRRPEVKK